MPTKQSTIQDLTKQIKDLNKDELKQVRDYTDNRLHEVDPDGSSKDQSIQNQLGEMNQDDLIRLRQEIDDRLISETDNRAASADASADDEKKKYIAQHGTHPLGQDTAQSVPQPVSDEIKDLQNKAAEIEQHAKGHAADGSH